MCTVLLRCVCVLLTTLIVYCRVLVSAVHTVLRRGRLARNLSVRLGAANVHVLGRL